MSSIVLFISSTFASVPGGHHQFRPLDPAVTLLIYLTLGLVAAAFFPEGRALFRRLEAWATVETGAAAISVGLFVTVLIAGVVLT